MLFNDTRKRRRSRLHYGTANKARQTLKYLKTRPYPEQIRGAQTMYYRAKYHAKQTKGMRNAMGLYKRFLESKATRKNKNR
jgi:hypothetical protein